jgi:hypothetical protein
MRVRGNKERHEMAEDENLVTAQGRSVQSIKPVISRMFLLCFNLLLSSRNDSFYACR